jgi:predicted transcriptional regulator
MSEELLRIIIGDIASNANYGVVMKKWREMFKIKQGLVADELKIKQSVVSDYESERVKNPGIRFVRDYSLAVIKIAKDKNYPEYLKVLKHLKIKDEKSILYSDEFKSEHSNSELMKIFKANQVVMPKEKVNVKNYVFFFDNISKVLTSNPSYKLLTNLRKDTNFFIFTNVKTGKVPVIIMNIISSLNKIKSPKILLFSGESFKNSWIEKKFAKNNNICVLITKMDKIDILKKLDSM